jgi:hypothetical protein
LHRHGRLLAWLKHLGGSVIAKKIGIGVVVLLLIVGGAAWYLLSNLDSIVKAAIEKYGSEATQASVTVDSVKITLSSGEGTLSGVTVGNPKGFATSNAMTLGSVTVKLDSSSVTGSGPIVIKEIDVNQPQVIYEVGNGGSNLQTIQKNAQEYAQSMSSGGASGASTSSASSSGGGQERKVVIDDLYVRSGHVGVNATALKGKTLTVPLPDIHLTNIGKSSGGATPVQVADRVLGAISDAVTKAGSSALAQEVSAAVSGAVPGAQGLGSQIKGLLREVGAPAPPPQPAAGTAPGQAWPRAAEASGDGARLASSEAHDQRLAAGLLGGKRSQFASHAAF